MFSAKQIKIRTLPIRLLALCLTAGFGVFVDQLMHVGTNTALDQSVVINSPDPQLQSTLVITNIPRIAIPESFRRMRNRRFWVFTQADLDSDGLVKNITVNFFDATTVKQHSLWDGLLFHVSEDQRRSIMRELAETLVGQISQLKFEPALTKGVPRLSHVVVSTYFHSSNDGPSIRWEVETSIETRFDSLDMQVVGGHRMDQSFIDK